MITSQCSTVVRNTVVRAIIKVNGKPQILGTRSRQTPESMNLKFDLDDCVGGVIHVPKWYKSAQQGRRGKGMKYSVQLGYFFLFFLLYLPSSGEHIFESIAVFFALNDVFRWELIS